jgi:hypothetical protein
MQHIPSSKGATNYSKAINIIAKLSSKQKKPFEQSILGALNQFKRDGYVKRLKSCITSESLPSCHQNLSAFLYDQISHI